ncbi:peptidase U32 family protein, partial [Desulfobacter sp.]|uniref:peptidase U32 family protein n=1 Tax=Desulfobacter sp. TaxID=2294 RepID=UPI003D14F383
MTCQPSKQPTILAPAGDTHSFLAAIAAGADAIYCGLKIFSARMEAGNFSIEELARLTKLAHSKGIQVYVAFNSIIKESETDKVLRIIDKLARHADADALIIQDTAMISLAGQAGFKGKLHLSTLGNCTHPAGLEAAQKAGFSRVVLPREFSLDDIRAMAAAAPETMDIEVFVHGALCYSVSGRCYWSSWFGGKSALRGRCVQPCRRLYEQNGKKARYFSCLDLSADVLAKVLKEIPNISTWKIEGRKKSPHYVYYTVMAYKLLRDAPDQKKQALSFLEYALGRQGSHYNLLSHRMLNPLEHASETGSGLFLGRIKNPEDPYFISREALLPGDLLRIGYEEETFHQIQKVTRAIPKKGKYFLSSPKGRRINKGTSVFLIDRRGRELEEKLSRLGAELDRISKVTIRPSNLSSTHKNAGGRVKSSVQASGHRGKKQPDI